MVSLISSGTTLTCMAIMLTLTLVRRFTNEYTMQTVTKITTCKPVYIHKHLSKSLIKWGYQKSKILKDSMINEAELEFLVGVGGVK